MQRSPAEQRFVRNLWLCLYGGGLILFLSAALWIVRGRGAFDLDTAGFDLLLFGSAGALGGSLRSLAYLLAYRNLSEREQSQWRLESLVAPLTGTIAGILSYLVVAAVLVDRGAVNPAGQYLVSLMTGYVALSQLGKLAERGVLRSGLSRSGILGAEPSSTAPLLERVDRLLERRVADLVVVNYSGTLSIASQFVAPEVIVVSGRFVAADDRASRGFASDDLRSLEASTDVPLEVSGGDERSVVPFTLAIESATFEANPVELAVSAPTVGSSGLWQFFLTRPSRSDDEFGATGPSTRNVTRPDLILLQIGQGARTIQVARVPVPRDE